MLQEYGAKAHFRVAATGDGDCVAVLFDTGPRPRLDHDEELASLFAAAGTPTGVSHLDGRLTRTVVERWRFGSHDLFRARGDGLMLSRSPAQVGSDAPEAIRLGYQQRGQYTLVASGQAEQGGHGRVSITDQTQPCVFTQAGSNAVTASFEISFAQLDLRPDAIRRARSQLWRSPVYTLLQGHLARLYESVGSVELTDTGPLVGNATALLARAAIASIGDTSARGRDAMKEALYQQIVEYTLQHLRDPATTPERIAAAHNISLRHLYRLWARNELGLAEWLMRERLAGAARDLRDPAQEATPIAAIARTWGFSDPAHFSRRFRLAYSMSPRSWRHERPVLC
jgi:AraC-like DNA-binding protein